MLWVHSDHEVCIHQDNHSDGIFLMCDPEYWVWYNYYNVSEENIIQNNEVSIKESILSKL